MGGAIWTSIKSLVSADGLVVWWLISLCPSQRVAQTLGLPSGMAEDTFRYSKYPSHCIGGRADTEQSRGYQRL